MKNLSKLLKIILFVSCANCSFAQNVQFMWLNQVGNTPGVGITKANSVISDISKDIYVAGYTNVALNNSSIQHGKNDYFLTKYNESGIQIWSLQVGAVSPMGTPGVTRVNSASINRSGYVYVTGSTNVAIFGKGSHQKGIIDYFIAKYNNKGDLLWSTQYGIADNTWLANGIANDAVGDIFVVGTTANKDKSSSSGFITKYLYNKLLMTKLVTLNGYSYTNITGIAIDLNNNVYVTGNLSNDVNFNSSYYFVIKYNSDLQQKWVKIVTTYQGLANSIAVDLGGLGYVYVAGAELKTTSNYFLSKFNTSFPSILWTQTNQSWLNNPYYKHSSVANSVCIDRVTGSIYVAGSLDNEYSFVEGYTKDGNPMNMGLTDGNGGITSATSISAINGNLYTAGYTNVNLWDPELKQGLYNYFLGRMIIK